MKKTKKNTKKKRGKFKVGQTIQLSKNVRQEEPLAFMVFSHEKFNEDFRIFDKENEAMDFAGDQAESANENEWPVYALFATDWKKVNIVNTNES